MLFDTHVHFDGVKDDLTSMLERAKDAGVKRFVAIGGSIEANQAAVAVATANTDSIVAAVGYDRDCAGTDCPLDQLESLVKQEEVHAIGEIGLDFHYHPETRDAQLELFSSMLSVAREHQLPVVVHSREAQQETLELLTKHAQDWTGDKDRLGVLHCFTGDAQFAVKLVELGYYVSFSGIVTFKTADEIRDAVKMVPDDRLLIETDTPYLAPVPFRGKKNEPAFVLQVAEQLAEVRGVTLDEIAKLTTANAQRMFGIDEVGT